MKNILSAIILATAATAGFAQAAPSDQPYIWTAGEAGLIANPNYKSPVEAKSAFAKAGNVDRNQTLYIVGVGEASLIPNPAFSNLPTTINQALFKAGVGEVSLVELPALSAVVMAAK
jgi:hypothetical protein